MNEIYEKVIDERYPDGYFDHYIAMFQSEVNEEGFEEHANTYITIEGIEEFKKLIYEIVSIDKNNDWSHFVNLANDYEMGNLDLKNIKKLAQKAIEVSENHNT